MPIECMLVPKGSKIGIKKEISPGAYDTYSDYRTGGQKVIAVCCHPYDYGGEIYVFDKDKERKGFDEHRIPQSDFTPAREPIPMHPGAKFAVEIVGKDKNNYTLIIKHVGEFATLYSNN